MCVGAPLALSAGGASAALPRVAPAASAGPLGGAVDLAFLADGTGVLVVDGPFGPSSSRAAVQVTRDDGAHWRTVWHADGIHLGPLGTRDGVVYVTGERDVGGSGGLTQQSTILLVGTDRGRRWRSVRTRLPDDPARAAFTSMRPAFVSSRVGFALPDPSWSDVDAGQELLHTTDGGRDWSVVHGVYATGGILFSDPQHGLLTGALGKRSRCAQVLRTADAGASWQPVAGTCVTADLDALGGAPGGAAFAAGGNVPKFGFFPQLTVMAGDPLSGGWRTRYARGGLTAKQGGGGGGIHGPSGQFIGIAVPDPVHPVALAGGCPGGANPPCAGRLWTTTDAGRHWRDTGQSGSAFAAPTARDLWLVDTDHRESAGVLRHSTDGGRRWTTIARPGTLAPFELLGSPARLFAVTLAGDFVTGDGAASWRPAGDHALSDGTDSAAIRPQTIAGTGLIAGAYQDGALWVSRDGGRSGARVRPPGFDSGGVPTVAFGDAAHGLAVEDHYQGQLDCRTVPTGSKPDLAVVTTADSGHSWRVSARLPATAGAGAPLAASGRLAVLAGPCLKGRETVGLSRDGGAHWALYALPPKLVCSSVGAASQSLIALSCAPSTRAPNLDRLLVSQDGGSTWTDLRFASNCAADRPCVLTAAFGRLWLAGTGVLWSSRDGRRWTAAPARYPVRP